MGVDNLGSENTTIINVLSVNSSIKTLKPDPENCIVSTIPFIFLKKKYSKV